MEEDPREKLTCTTKERSISHNKIYGQKHSTFSTGCWLHSRPHSRVLISVAVVDGVHYGHRDHYHLCGCLPARK